MRRLVVYALITFTLVFLPGCVASLPAPLVGECHNKTLPMLLDATDLKALFQDISTELCVDTCSDCPASVVANGGAVTQTCGNRDGVNRQTVLVTDFADIQSYLPNQSGLLMGELMRGGLNSVCCYRIIQAEFAKYFKLSENGLVVLTRKVSEIKKDEYLQSEAVVGTYSYLNNNKVIIFVRKINTESGKISRMVTRELTYTCSGRSVMGYSVK